MDYLDDTPKLLDDSLAALLDQGVGACLETTVTVRRDWQPETDHVRLAARYDVVEDGLGPALQVRLGRHRLALDEPVGLEGVRVPKPWGQEIWLTGIEARGESRVVTSAGTLPLADYLALAPRRLCRGAPLVLLKILDPRAEPVLGELYLEVHERKHEVYVVTHVDPAAWPTGAGRIRLGVDQALRGRGGDDAAFRSAFLAAVQDYQRVRRAIDAGEAVPLERESALRAAMNAFIAERELRQGQVVVVPPWLPHSLQHGVRVIEFQTPTYERYIIAFAQRVLTQGHWDSEAAVARMSLEPPVDARFDTLHPGVERIVAFDDFRVWRATIAPGSHFDLPAHPAYALCVTAQGAVRLAGLRLAAEEGALVPSAALSDPGRRRRHARLTNDGDEPAVVLIAAPDL